MSLRVVLVEMHDYTSLPAASPERARDIARDLLATMWRRPGATLSIVDGTTVLWTWTGWRHGADDPRAHAPSFNAWVLGQQQGVNG